MIVDTTMTALVVVAVLVCAWVIGYGLVLARRARRPMSADWCRECMKDLRRGEVYELRLDHEADDQGGGTYLAATYCHRHAPKGALRV